MLHDIDLSKAELPPVIKRNGMEYYQDPVRRMPVQVKPEETIRQKLISYLISELRVPAEMIRVEEPLADYGIDSEDRADIVITKEGEKKEIIPIAVIECKAPTVFLDAKAHIQLQKYGDALYVTYIMLTNGHDSFCYAFDEEENTYVDISSLPVYKDMTEGKFTAEEVEKAPERIPFEELESSLTKEWEACKSGEAISDIGYGTPISLALPAYNLFEGLLDARVKMPSGDYGLFHLIKDCGVRMMTYGNASGGQFYGPYRMFETDVNGKKEYYSISFSWYFRNSWEADHPPVTSMNIAHDNDMISHHALQLIIDDNCGAIGNEMRFYHNGKISVGRQGSGKKAELMDLVEKRYPKIIDGNRYYLGKVTNDHLLRLDEQDVINLIVNLVSYSIIRDEYREILKDRK